MLDRFRVHASHMFAGTLLLSSAIACNEVGIPAGTSPHREFNFLDMSDQPKIKAQRGDLLGGPDFMPPEGAIPIGFDPYPFPGRPEEAGRRLRNPLDSTDSIAGARGKLVFERYCVPCHDPSGGGKGTVVEKGFPQPPSLMTQKVRDWPDGRIYHVISQGQNIMPSYASQIRPQDRWAAVLHVREMQHGQPVAAPPADVAPGASALPTAGAAPAPTVPERNVAADSGGVAPPASAASGASSAAPESSASPRASATPSSEREAL